MCVRVLFSKIHYLPQCSMCLSFTQICFIIFSFFYIIYDFLQVLSFSLFHFFLSIFCAVVYITFHGRIGIRCYILCTFETDIMSATLCVIVIFLLDTKKNIFPPKHNKKNFLYFISLLCVCVCSSNQSRYCSYILLFHFQNYFFYRTKNE